MTGFAFLLTGGAASEVKPHFWNPSDKSASITLSNANLRATSPSGIHAVRANTAYITSGTKIVFAGTKVGGTIRFGIANAAATLTNALGGDTNSIVWHQALGQIFSNNGNVFTTGQTLSDGDVVMVGVYYDPAGGATADIYFGKNGTWLNSGDPENNTGAVITNFNMGAVSWFAVGGATVSQTIDLIAYPYTVPTGWQALSV